MNIVLASQSPRRQELMALITKDFTTDQAHIDEPAITKQLLNATDHPDPANRIELLVKELATAKGKAVLDKHPESIVIGADTMILTKDGDLLGKPVDQADACATLQQLSKDGYHTVYTGISILMKQIEISFATNTIVHFNELSPIQEQLIQEYVASGSPLDKAGSYSIGDRGALLIEKIDGDYYTILGFPIAQIFYHLEMLNV